MNHWAFNLIGKPWVPGARGPDAFDCLGLVNWCARLRLGLTLPELHQIANSHWHRAAAPLRADDVVLMQGPAGRHIGFMVDASGRLGVLHADGCLTPRGPVGCVVFQSLEQATAGGYHKHEFWRLDHAST